MSSIAILVITEDTVIASRISTISMRATMYSGGRMEVFSYMHPATRRGRGGLFSLVDKSLEHYGIPPSYMVSVLREFWGCSGEELVDLDRDELKRLRGVIVESRRVAERLARL